MFFFNILIENPQYINQYTILFTQSVKAVSLGIDFKFLVCWRIRKILMMKAAADPVYT